MIEKYSLWLYSLLIFIIKVLFVTLSLLELLSNENNNLFSNSKEYILYTKTIISNYIKLYKVFKFSLRIYNNNNNIPDRVL